ncbi:DNA-3-methyladenine glycosylase I [Magnetospira thiophila]
MSWYCDAAPGHPVHQGYHDEEYGFPKTDERALFELLCLEIFQAGLNWELVLKKREGMRAAFEGFEVDRVASYGAADRQRLLADPRIIRNGLKVDALIHNARVIQNMRASHDGFAAWLAAHHPLCKRDWVKLFKQIFKFTGGEITNEFLMCIGYLPGAHRESCPIFALTRAAGAAWMNVDPSVYVQSEK